MLCRVAIESHMTTRISADDGVPRVLPAYRVLIAQNAKCSLQCKTPTWSWVGTTMVPLMSKMLQRATLKDAESFKIIAFTSGLKEVNTLHWRF
jgi:hypothetical protein